jgi:uncharacterized Ntn-hydrolase superfamily protein
VPAGRAGVGVVTVTGKSQAHWQSTVLDRLAAGESPEAIVADLTQDDLSNRTRQIGIVGFDGKAATFTGPANLKLSASVSGDGFAIVLDQARDLTVVDEIEEAFRESAGLPLPERLLAAIAASAQIDGTGRPYLSGCLLVYREGGGPDGETDRFVDIRVDFDLDVIEKLKTIYATTVTVFTGPRLRKLHKALFDTSNPLYKANRDWLKRLRTPHEVGVLKRD